MRLVQGTKLPTAYLKTRALAAAILFNMSILEGTASSPPKYSENDLPEYTPMPYTLAEIRAKIPPRLFVRDTTRGLLYLARDILMAAFAWKLATYIDPTFQSDYAVERLGTLGAEVGRWAGWCV